MRLAVGLLLFVSAAAPSLPQSQNGLEVSRKVRLDEKLEDLVAYGLVKEMACDGAGNIFTPAMRKYTEVTDSVVRISPDAKSYLRFSLDQIRQLQDGDIIDFAVERSGEIFVLARQVLEYSDLQVPRKFGDTFVIHYDGKANVTTAKLTSLDSFDSRSKRTILSRLVLPSCATVSILSPVELMRERGYGSSHKSSDLMVG